MESDPQREPMARGSSANDRLKARWNAYVARSTIAAVAVHAVIFGFWPSWDRDRSLVEPEDFEAPVIEWITLLQAPESRSGGLPVSLAMSDVSDSLALEPDLEERVQGREAERAGLSDAMLERLLRGASTLPRMATREPEPPTPEPEDTGEDSTSTIEGDASTAELLDVPSADELDLGRLSGIRPELALVAPSAWVLIRNPRDVEQFILRSYRQGRIPRDARGSVSVTLWIDEGGSVEWAEVSESSGQTSMDEVALDLFSDVIAFRPARDEGVPVSRSVVFSVQFPWF